MNAKERRELIEEVFKQCEAVGGRTNDTAIYRGYVNAADVFERMRQHARYFCSKVASSPVFTVG